MVLLSMYVCTSMYIHYDVMYVEVKGHYKLPYSENLRQGKILTNWHKENFDKNIDESVTGTTL